MPSLLALTCKDYHGAKSCACLLAPVLASRLLPINYRTKHPTNLQFITPHSPSSIFFTSIRYFFPIFITFNYILLYKPSITVNLLPQRPLLGFINSHSPLFVTPQASAALPGPTAQTNFNL